MSGNSKEKLSIDRIKLILDNQLILNDISFDLNTTDNTDSITIIGRSGAGKSALLKCILGIYHPFSGSITFNNQPIIKRNKEIFFNKLGMVFQNSALFDSLSVWENVGFKYLYGPNKMPKKNIKKLAEEKLERVGLSIRSANQFPIELSGGMQKRAAIARAIITEPKILFFDEPTAGLDPITARKINYLIKELISDSKASALTITHDINTVNTIADRVFLMNEGKFVWIGCRKNMKTSSDEYIKNFLNTE
tara:strand:+ start:871 stop:1620 length:750 start_codon:yes stop_codon:yes gene_type:complete